MLNSVSPERKLAAILHADVVGYSRMMGEDEASTHRTLKEYLDAFADAITNHQGRVVNYAGDAVLAEFVTVTDALDCAVTVLRDLDARNETLPDERKVRFRVGINLGEVIVDGDDIYGDEVNIAARLESLAEPGGICISESARSAIGKKLPFAYHDMGGQQVKNIAEPVRAYRVLPEPAADNAEKALKLPARPLKPGRWIIVVAIAVAAVIAVFAYQRLWNPGEPGVAQEPIRPAGPRTDHASIAILPFTNMSDDPKQEYFVDGMTEDLITDLSKVSSLLVIARHSVFAYKGKNINVRQIGQELGVRYVLEGSVRKAGEQVRINAQLIDTATGGHLWAERYDRRLQDIFALQDEVTEQIIAALAIKLTESERRQLALRYTDNLQAYDYFLRAQEQYFQQSSESYEPARVLFRKAIELDPNFARAYSALANTYGNEVLNGYSDRAEDALGRALELARTAIALDDSLPHAYFQQGFILLLRNEHDQALAATHKALALDPNYADGYLLLAFIYIHTSDRAGDAFAPLERYLQLDPNYSAEYLGILAQAYYWTGQYGKAEESFQQALERNPNYLYFRLFLISTYVRLQQIDDAEWEREEVLALKPDFSLALWAQERFFQDPKQLEQLLDDLRRAGFTE